MPYILKKYFPPRNIIFIIGEGLLIYCAMGVTYLSFVGLDRFVEFFPYYSGQIILVTFIFQLCLYYFSLYNLSVIPSYTDTAIQITQAFGFGCIVLGVLYFLFPDTIISTKIFWSGYFAISAVIAGWRFGYTIVLKRRMFTQSVLIFGSGKLAQDIVNEIESTTDSGYKIVAVLDEENPKYNPQNLSFIISNDDMIAICQERHVDRVVVALDDKRGRMPIKDLMRCKLMGIKIDKGIDFYEELTGKIMVERVNPSWIIFSDGFALAPLSHVVKRTVDIIMATVGLVVSLPIILISALIIKLESRGPVFYRQERVGAHNSSITVTKFRSMRADAEKDGPVWAAQDDDRTTRFGRFMRKCRIDEIPQMWTVLKGEMSFVGPRPERPFFVEQLEGEIPYYSIRHNVKPGITGWAQIFYPYGASEEDALRKLEYDLYYIKNYSLGMDLWIFFQTIKTVLFREGSR